MARISDRRLKTPELRLTPAEHITRKNSLSFDRRHWAGQRVFQKYYAGMPASARFHRLKTVTVLHPDIRVRRGRTPRATLPSSSGPPSSTTCYRAAEAFAPLFLPSWRHHRDELNRLQVRHEEGERSTIGDLATSRSWSGLVTRNCPEKLKNAFDGRLG